MSSSSVTHAASAPLPRKTRTRLGEITDALSTERGTVSVAENVDLDASNPEAVIKYVTENEIGLTVIGPEAPLADGIVDAFPKDGQHFVFGPSKAAARLESSKRWSKEVMASAGVPTAGWRGFSNAEDALTYVSNRPGGSVVKASGLAAGKGV